MEKIRYKLIEKYINIPEQNKLKNEEKHFPGV